MTLPDQPGVESTAPRTERKTCPICHGERCGVCNQTGVIYVGNTMTTATVRRRWEDEAMKVVVAVKRDLVPDMDDNDGGQLLVWILDLCEKVSASSSSVEAGRPTDQDARAEAGATIPSTGSTATITNGDK